MGSFGEASGRLGDALGKLRRRFGRLWGDSGRLLGVLLAAAQHSANHSACGAVYETSWRAQVCDDHGRRSLHDVHHPTQLTILVASLSRGRRVAVPGRHSQEDFWRVLGSSRARWRPWEALWRLRGGLVMLWGSFGEALGWLWGGFGQVLGSLGELREGFGEASGVFWEASGRIWGGFGRL